MKKHKTPTIHSNKKIMLTNITLLVFLAGLNYLFYFYINQSLMNLFAANFCVLVTPIIIYQYFNQKCLRISGIEKHDFEKSLEYALSVNNIETSKLPDGLFKTKKLQIKDSNITLHYQHSSWLNAVGIVFKKAKDAALYDKIFASITEYINDNNITRQIEYKKIGLLTAILIVIGIVVGLGVGYFLNVAGY